MHVVVSADDDRQDVASRQDEELVAAEEHGDALGDQQGGHEIADLAMPEGSRIPIEERAEDEVTCWQGRRLAPAGVKVLNPAFDLTPARYVTALITDRGIVRNGEWEKLQQMHGCGEKEELRNGQP